MNGPTCGTNLWGSLVKQTVFSTGQAYVCFYLTPRAGNEPLEASADPCTRV